MLKKVLYTHILLSFFLLLNLSAQSITIGTIDGEAENKLSKFEAIANYLQSHLEKDDLEINVEIPKDIPTAIKLIKAKKLDIFMDSVYPTLLIQKDTNISIALKRWKKGQEGYRSIIFTKKDSPINNIKDLKGKIIAFEDSFSTSAYFVPKKAIEKENILLSNNPEDKNALKYLFSKNEMNTAAWLIFKKVDVAATDDITFNTFEKNLYKVIYKSNIIARQLVSFSKKINPKLKKEIINILLTMHENEEGREVLKTFSKTKKFTILKKDEIKPLELNQ